MPTTATSTTANDEQENFLKLKLILANYQHTQTLSSMLREEKLADATKRNFVELEFHSISLVSCSMSKQKKHLGKCQSQFLLAKLVVEFHQRERS